MKLLESRIIKDGTYIDNHFIKVDSFLNHQVDSELMLEIGKEFEHRFGNKKIDRILTMESSGIAIAMATSVYLHVPFVFAHRYQNVPNLQDCYAVDVKSETKATTFHVTVSKEFLQPGDRILILDDFLAHGHACSGLAKMVESAGGKVVGIGVVVEKLYQAGRQALENEGYRVEALASIEAVQDGKVIFARKQR